MFNIATELDKQIIINAAVIGYMKDSLNTSDHEIAKTLVIPEEKVKMYYEEYAKPLSEDNDNINHSIFTEIYLAFIDKNDAKIVTNLYKNISPHKKKGGKKGKSIRTTQNNAYWMNKDLTKLSDKLIRHLGEVYYYVVFCDISTGKVSKYLSEISQSSICKYIELVIPRILALSDDSKVKQIFLEGLNYMKSVGTENIPAEVFVECTGTRPSTKEPKPPIVEIRPKVIEASSKPSFESVLNEYADVKIRISAIKEVVNNDLEYFLDLNLNNLTRLYNKLNISLDQITAKEYLTKSYNDQFKRIIDSIEARLYKLDNMYYELLSKENEEESQPITIRKSENADMLSKLWELIDKIKGDKNE